MEVILDCLCRRWQRWGILHVCGGDPSTWCGSLVFRMYSPRMWRWSCPYVICAGGRGVFSTYVEVILTVIFIESKWICILHVCGGDPMLLVLATAQLQYSPRMWRWSFVLSDSSCSLFVFSTYVEVIPWKFNKNNGITSILHVCGGDPTSRRNGKALREYSPRMWRWSYLQCCKGY